MIDNSIQIRELLKFPKETSFYFVQILQRRKENPELEKNARNVDNFFIYSFEDFDKYLPKIIDCCNRFNARAYFRLNLRDAEVIAQRAIQKSFDLLISGNFRQVKNAYLHACGEYHSDPDKTWVVDIDGIEGVRVATFRIRYKLQELYNGTHETPVVAELPTKNGMHIITRPVRLDVFKHEFPQIDVHKDNPTILYAP